MKVSTHSPEGFSERLYDALEEKGISRAELARVCNRDRRAVTRWLYDRVSPDLACLAKMCSFLNVSADWLLFGKES